MEVIIKKENVLILSDGGYLPIKWIFTCKDIHQNYNEYRTDVLNNEFKNGKNI